MCNFGRGYTEEQFWEIILNLDQSFRICLLKIFLTWNSGSPFVQRSLIICTILVELIQRNNSVKLFEIGPVVQGFLIWSSGSPPVRWSGTICAILKEGIIGNIFVMLFEIWTSGLGGDALQRKS